MSEQKLIPMDKTMEMVEAALRAVKEADPDSQQHVTQAALCANSSFFCADFFDQKNTLYLAYIIVKLLLFTFVLFLSCRIPKDFLRSFTVVIFIPFLVEEMCRLGVFIIAYMRHFEISAEEATDMAHAEEIMAKIHETLAYIAYYCFLTMSIIVYFGLFKAFLNPEGYERSRITLIFNLFVLIPLVIVGLINVPWPQSVSVMSIYIKHGARILLGIAIIPFYLFSVCRLSFKKQQRETKIDERSIIRRAKSRLVWFTVYMTVQNIVNFPEFVEGILYVIGFSIDSVLLSQNYQNAMDTVFFVCSIADEVRPVAVVLSTLVFIPVYREAVFFCRRAPRNFKSPVLDLSTPE